MTDHIDIAGTRAGHQGLAMVARTVPLLACLAFVMSSCTATTSGSQRLDETGNRMAENGIALDSADDTPATSTQVVAALRGGLVARMAGLQLSPSDRNRALEAEYNTLESAPAGQQVAWESGSGARGQVMAATPYQVGDQNCRQYTHTVTLRTGQAITQRGAACRNPNGSWSPLD